VISPTVNTAIISFSKAGRLEITSPVGLRTYEENPFDLPRRRASLRPRGLRALEIKLIVVSTPWIEPFAASGAARFALHVLMYG
jgi:hypothetical protein